MNKFDEWYNERIKDYLNDKVTIDTIIKESWNTALEKAIKIMKHKDIDYASLDTVLFYLNELKVSIDE